MNNFNIKEKKKLHNIFLVLSGLFITNAIIAEILGTKIFDVSIIKDFSLSVGVVIWPVVFITTDIINEYFGKKGVKKVSYFTILLIVYVFIIIFLSTKLTPNSYWLDVNKFDNSGKDFLMHHKWPSGEVKIDQSQKDVEKIINIISELRSFKNELNVSPGSFTTISISNLSKETKKFVNDNSTVLKKLC